MAETNAGTAVHIVAQLHICSSVFR